MRPDAAEAIGDLIDRSHLLDPSHFTAGVRASAALMGVTDVEVLLTDYEQRVLMPLVAAGHTDGQIIETTLAGRAFATGELQFSEHDGRSRVWVPLLDGVDRVGVVGFDVDDLQQLDLTGTMRFAALLTQLVVTKSKYSDIFDRASQRSTPTVAAHVQLNQLPPRTFATHRVAIAGILEPAYDIGGDAFDYAQTDERTHIVMLDSMGHGLKATWPATLAMAGLRHARQRGLTLPERYDECSRLLADQLTPYEFVAAQVAELENATGTLRWMNAGLPRPLLVRGGKVIGELDCDPNLPLGVPLAGQPRVNRETLEPWDRVLFFTDGVIEGHRPGREPFGIERLVDLLGRGSLAGAGPAEAVRRLSHAVIDHNLHDLRDDFTMLLVEYRGAGDDVEAVEHTYRLPIQHTV